jgi:hypothetical protein
LEVVVAVSEPALPEALVAFLCGGQVVVLATADADGNLYTTLVTWVVARDNRTLFMAIDQRGRALNNIRTRDCVALEIMGDDITYGCRGRARVVKEAMITPPFPSAIIEITIEEVRNHASPGVVFRGPNYTFLSNKQHHAELEQAIYMELLQG